MEDSTLEVVEGSNLATNAGKFLEEIDSVTDQLANLIGSISVSTNEQAQTADELAKSMNEISKVTTETASGSKQAADSAGQLVNMSEGLRGSVSRFKLPGARVESQRETQWVDTDTIAPSTVV